MDDEIGIAADWRSEGLGPTNFMIAKILVNEFMVAFLALYGGSYSMMDSSCRIGLRKISCSGCEKREGPYDNRGAVKTANKKQSRRWALCRAVF